MAARDELVQLPNAADNRAVFGLYPQLAGRRRTSHATDNALRAGVVATGPATFQPAIEPAARSGPVNVPLPAGVAPSTAGAGRGTINPMATLPSVPSPGGAGAGRGTVNPAPDVNTVTGEKIPAAVTLAGQPGAAVAGAPGVSKFKTADGRTLYSNVPGGDNDTLMSGKPGLQVAPAAAGNASAAMASGTDTAAITARASQIYADMARINEGIDQPGVLSNGAGMRVVGTTNGLFRAPTDPGTPSLSTIPSYGGAVSGREQARIASAERIAAGNNATSRANNQDSVAAQLAGQQTSAATSRYSVDTQNKTAAQRLAMDAGTNAVDVKLKTAQLKAATDLDAARTAFTSATDPKAKEKALETLRALQGKYEREYPELFSTTALPGSTDALGNKTPGGAIVTDKRTGATRIIYGNELAAPAGGKAPPAIGTVKDGYRFKGGNPADQKSWEKA